MNDKNQRLIDGAMQNKRKAVVAALADGADPNWQGSATSTAIHWAAFHGNAKMLEDLIAWGANVNAVAPDCTTPLHLACEEQHLKCIHLLLTAGADVSAKTLEGKTPIEIVANLEGQPGRNHKMYKLVCRLVAYGADVDVKDQAGFTPLMSACWRQNWGAAIALINCGADVNATSSEFDFTALQLTDPKTCSMVINALLAAGADPNLRSSLIPSPLSRACSCGATESALALIDAGADIELDLENGPLALACEQGMKEVVEAMMATAHDEHPFEGISAHDRKRPANPGCVLI